MIIPYYQNSKWPNRILIRPAVQYVTSGGEKEDYMDECTCSIPENILVYYMGGYYTTTKYPLSKNIDLSLYAHGYLGTALRVDGNPGLNYFYQVGLVLYDAGSTPLCAIGEMVSIVNAGAINNWAVGSSALTPGTATQAALYINCSIFTPFAFLTAYGATFNMLFTV